VKKLIRCPQFGADNKENSNFCEVCGEGLKATSKFCPECGKENVEIAKFCENCGTRLKTPESGKIGSKVQNKKIPDLQANISINKPNKTVSLNLTPAESLIILDHKKHKSSPKDLLKSTLIDLIFKNVYKLDVQEVEKKGIFASKIVKKIYLQEGKNFNMPLKPHEEVFRDCLPHKSDSKRLRKLQQCVNNSYRNDYAKKKLLEPLISEGYFNVEKKFLGKKYSLTDKGIKTRQMILELKEQGKNLENWIETDPERAKAYLLMGGSNIFLTDDYHFEWFKNNSKKISKLFAGVAVGAMVYKFSHIRWYSAFKAHDIDFDDFGDDFGIDTGFDDIFSDFDAFDVFDSLDDADFDSFDSGFDIGGFDGGDFGGGDF